MVYYNDEVKQEFLEHVSSRSSRVKAVNTLFKALAPYEASYAKDVCAFNKQELYYALGGAFPLRTKSMRMFIAILREYSTWCIDNGIDGACEAAYEIEPDDIGLDKIREQMVANPQHLQRYMDCVFQPEDLRTVQNTYRARFWMAFAGIDEEDAFNVKTSEVDFDLMTIEHGGKSYPIYRESLKCMHNCVSLNSFVYIHPLYDKRIDRPRTPGDMLLRGTGDDATNETVMLSLRANVSKEIRLHDWSKDSQDMKIKLNYGKAKLSGMFYRAYEAERAGVKVDFYASVDEYMAGKEYNYTNTTYTSVRNNLERGCESDYSRWKRAFKI